MIASLHLADVGKPAALRLLATRLDPGTVAGMRYAAITTTAPLSGQLLPRPTLGRIAMFAAWDDDQALDTFLRTHALAERLADGWHVRLQPTRIFGSWPQLSGLLVAEEPIDDGQPTAVLTLGHLRIAQAIRFLKASAAAEGLAVRHPALLASTGLARPPALVATFSIWQNTVAMRSYVDCDPDQGHLAAVRSHAARPFHHESAFLRFRPYRAEGDWGGRGPVLSTD
jgi:quinol monooxygenase YgiN